MAFNRSVVVVIIIIVYGSELRFKREAKGTWE
jgi:hypothetical protein